VPERICNYQTYIPLTVKNNVDEAQGYIDRKDLDKAIELLLRSFETEETPVVFRMLGILYSQKGEQDKSHEFLLKAYSEFKFDAQFLKSFIIVGMATRHLDEAKNALEQLRKIDPNNAEISKLQMVLR